MHIESLLHRQWGPHRLLWSTLGTLPPLSYADWVAAARHGAAGRAAAKGASGRERSHGGRRSALVAPLFIETQRAIFALSGEKWWQPDCHST